MFQAEFLIRFARKHRQMTQEIFECPILVAAQKTNTLKKYVKKIEKYYSIIRKKGGIPSEKVIQAIVTLYKKAGMFQKAEMLLKAIERYKRNEKRTPSKKYL
jgi:hypothetical protein